MPTTVRPPYVSDAWAVTTLDAKELAVRIRYKEPAVRNILCGPRGLVPGRHYSRAPGRRIVFLWDAICADMGLPHPNFGPGDFLTTAEAARMARVLPATLRTWIAKGRAREHIHYVRLPSVTARKILFLRDGLHQLIGLPVDPVVFSPPAPLASPRAAPPSPLLSDFAGSDAFMAAAERWLIEDTANMTARASGRYRDVLRRVLKPYFEGLSVYDISTEHVLDSLQSVLHEYGQATAELAFDFLRRLFERTARRFSHRSPLAGVESLPTEFDRAPRVMSLPQCTALINAAPAHLVNYLKTRVFTGLSNDEAHSLRWRAVSFEDRTIRIDEEFIRGAWRPLPSSPRCRTIPMASTVLAALRDQFAVTRTSREPQFVFQDESGLPLTTRGLRPIWSQLLRDVGLAHLNLRELRHTSAYLWLTAGEAPERVAQWFGYGADVERLLATYRPLLATARPNLAIDGAIACYAPPRSTLMTPAINA